MKMMHKIVIFFYYLYSLFWCLRYLDFKQAIHIPILIHPKVKIKELHRGSITFDAPLRHGMFSFGFEGTIGQSNCRSLISIRKGGTLIVGSNVQMAKGTRIVINEKGIIKIGNHFWCNGDCYFFCTKSIFIGNDNMYGWNVSFNTSDGHNIYENGIKKTVEGDIRIGNNVWVASHCLISKNTNIPDGCVVAQKSLVSKTFDEQNCLIAGSPAKIVRNNISWEW
ncbi:MAG: acyltransferase [Prevotella sp.]|nr:acyltransferase [Prevotella sp.]